jgi:two-component system, cell cycle sensor histidine kinase and response regulator CckA
MNANKYKILFENSADANLVIIDGKFIDCNRATLKMLGYKDKKEVFSTHPSELSPELQPDGRDSMEKANEMMSYAMERGSHRFEWDHIRKNGEIFPVEVLLTAIQFEDTESIHVVWRDISERKKAEREKSMLEAQLQHTQKLETVGTLAGGIAHDFNNILAPILGYTDMMLDGMKDSDPLYADLKIVFDGAQRAKDLVEQILLFIKRHDKKRQAISLHTIVHEVLKLLRPSIPNSVDIKLDLDDSCGQIYADTTQIHQIIVNLCANAWQAMGIGGGGLNISLEQITVDAQLTKQLNNIGLGKYAKLSITDTGCGIKKENLSHVFEPFFTTKPVGEGTGLGLSVVHGIVQSHGGVIDVQSKHDCGAKFSVYLPIVKIPTNVILQDNESSCVGNETILFVDDEPAISQMAKKMLEKCGYRVDTFDNGFAALDAFTTQPGKYNLLISDLTMPLMNGLDLADKLIEENPLFPIIIITGYGAEVTDPIKDRASIKDVIKKPISSKALLSSIRSVLDE